MQLNLDDLKRQYAEYPDEWLLQLNRDDLTEAARSCYDAELARRGLTPPEAEEEVPIEENVQAEEPTEEAVVVGRFQNPDELADARDALENAKIPCFVDSGDSRESRQHPFVVKVPASFHGQAVAILHPELADPGSNLQPVATFPTAGDAEALRALLEAAEIPCQLAVMVPAEFYDRACEILEEEAES